MLGRFLLGFGALLCVGTAYAQRDAEKFMGLFSLPVLLAAFAGSALVLSIMKPSTESNQRIFGTISFCALMGAFFAPPAVRVIARYVEAFPGAGADVASAFLLAAVAQIVAPTVVARLPGLVATYWPKKKEST
jgi:hypothetical protein